MSLCVARRSRQAKNCCSCRGHEAGQSASSQIKPNQGSHQRKYENCHPPLRPSRPLRETNFTHPHQTGPKRTKTHLFADNFQSAAEMPRPKPWPAKFAETTPGNCRDAHLAKSRQILGNLGKSREISLCGGIYEQLRGLPVESD